MRKMHRNLHILFNMCIFLLVKDNIKAFLKHFLYYENKVLEHGVLIRPGHTEFFLYYNPVDYFNHFQSVLCVSELPGFYK